MNIVEVKGVYQCYCIGTNHSQELLHTLVHLSNLGVCQNTRLGKRKQTNWPDYHPSMQVTRTFPPQNMLVFPHPKIQWFFRCKISLWPQWRFVIGYKHEKMPGTVTIYHPTLLLSENKGNLIRAFHQNCIATDLKWAVKTLGLTICAALHLKHLCEQELWL